MNASWFLAVILPVAIAVAVATILLIRRRRRRRASSAGREVFIKVERM